MPRNGSAVVVILAALGCVDDIRNPGAWRAHLHVHIPWDSGPTIYIMQLRISTFNVKNLIPKIIHGNITVTILRCLTWHSDASDDESINRQRK